MEVNGQLDEPRERPPSKLKRFCPCAYLIKHCAMKTYGGVEVQLYHS
jgi:hypothetical protein